MKFYRYKIGVSFESWDEFEEFPKVCIKLHEFDSVKETTCGHWINTLSKNSYNKWISKTSKRKWAYPNKIDALENFRRRTMKWKRISSRNAINCEIALGQVPFLEKQLKDENDKNS